MAPRLKGRVVARIEDALRDPGMRVDKKYLRMLASDFRTSIRSIYRILRRVRLGQRVMPLSGGPTRIITSKMEQSIKILLDEMPWLYLDEIADFLHEV